MKVKDLIDKLQVIDNGLDVFVSVNREAAVLKDISTFDDFITLRGF